MRAFRALRFAVTKGLSMDVELVTALRDNTLDFSAVSVDRIRDEVGKMFRDDTRGAMRVLSSYPRYVDLVVDSGIWFKATTEDK